MKKVRNPEKGIALMIVLWALVLLSALATEFAFSMRTEVNTTGNYKEDVESYYLAKAGIHLAFAELLKEARFHSIHPEFGFISGYPKSEGIINSQNNENAETADLEESQEFDFIERIDLPLGRGTISYKITDENGKININTATRGVLTKVLTASGMEIGETRDIIADSILDWIDKDDVHLVNGAETDHYQTLDPPYQAKNDIFDTLDELLQVRGITEDILYGTPEDEIKNLDQPVYLGLINFFTVQKTIFFNPNTAKPDVLSVFFDDSKILEIMEAREQKGYYNDSLSSHFKIESTGKISDSQIKHTIIALVQKFGIDEKATLLIRYWKDSAV